MEKETCKVGFLRKKSTVRVENVPVLEVNLTYPVIKEIADEKKESRFARTVNRFYADSADNFIKQSAKRHAAKAQAICRKNGNIPCGFVMKCEVTENDPAYLSIFADLSFYDGKTVKRRRYSQLWSHEKCAVLPASFVFHTGTKQRAYLVKLITQQAKKNAEQGLFRYYDNYPALIKRHFQFSRFYPVPNGIAFYYDSGVLSGSDREPAVFVLSKNQIDGVLKRVL